MYIISVSLLLVLVFFVLCLTPSSILDRVTNSEIVHVTLLKSIHGLCGVTVSLSPGLARRPFLVLSLFSLFSLFHFRRNHGLW